MAKRIVKADKLDVFTGATFSCVVIYSAIAFLQLIVVGV